MILIGDFFTLFQGKERFTVDTDEALFCNTKKAKNLLLSCYMMKVLLFYQFSYRC